MSVREEHGIDSRELVFEGLVPEVWSGVDEDDPAIVKGEARRGSIAVIPWMV
jgi:hypothetical protein